MKKTLTGIISLQEGQSEIDFEEKFNNWISENGWIYNDVERVELPNKEFYSIHGAFLGTAVFHPNYAVHSNNLETNRRYFLRRIWDVNLPIMATFMMNPSSADEIVGDRTVDFMMKYAKNNGFGSLIVVNTSPVIKGSKTIANDFVIDEKNWFYINYVINKADLVVLGWGANGQKFGMPLLVSNYPVTDLFNKNIEKIMVFAFGNLTKSRIYPKHPHPQVANKRFLLDHKLIKVTNFDLDRLLQV